MRKIHLLFCFLFLQPFLTGHVIDLSKFEKTVYSQNGEDGVIKKLVKLVGSGQNYYVEFGAGNGYHISNTRSLRECGWSGLLLDACYEDHEINLHREFITAENICTLFEKYDVPIEFDLLSLDIDYNDFYVWKALLEKYRPRIAVIEYNAYHLPHDDKVALYNPEAMWDGTNYYGASILAMFRLGRKYGYSLVYAESKGVNLFFVRDDLVKGLKQSKKGTFLNINKVEKLYRPPQCPPYTIPEGHPADPLNREYVSSIELL